MAYPSVSNTLVASATAKAADVNTNFADLVNGLSDGTKNLNMNAAAFAGTVTAGNCTISASVTANSAHFASATVSHLVAAAATMTTGIITTMDATTISASNTATVGHLTISSGLASTSSPVANTLYSNSFIKAWSYTQSDGTVTDGGNVTCNNSGTGIYNYTFRTNMSTANYAVIATTKGTAETLYGINVNSKSTSTFTIGIVNSVGNYSSQDHHVMVCGD